MILERLFAQQTQPETTWDLKNTPQWVLDMFGGKDTSSGERVTEANALIHPDIFSCVQVLADDVAKLPVHTFLKNDSGVQRNTEHSVARLLSRKPNPYMTAFIWKKLMMTHVTIRGNAYSLIEFDKYGEIKSLVPLNPEHTRPYVDPKSGMLWYQTSHNGKPLELYDEQVLHFKGMSEDGINGKSPIAVVREHIGAQAAATKYNAKLYKNDATPRGILKVPTMLKSPAKDEVRKEWKRVNAGESIAIVDNGLEYQSISVPLQDAQFIESMKFNKSQISAIFKVPLHKVNELERSTFNNIEHQSIEYVKNTLQPWLTMFEQEINTKCFTDKELDDGYYVRYNVNSELRGDSKSRAEFYEIMQRISGLNTNEIRELEERNGIGDIGNRHLVTLNYTFLDLLEQYQIAKATKGGGK
ncbi:phage portal protein [Bacillus thuringiensis]|uniref:Phage portal protein n=1 Tax=Bacillus thuringiensis TaxID=1428 RepID=A0A4Y8T4J1_BACTU|nr:phage portal protein [Bacillus thuringiensis]TFF45781.1 phage portal protein [Bacillus thuringiensis]